MKYDGACHCGDIRVAFETALAGPPLRACQCSFCRRHGAKTTSDPDGRLAIELAAPIAYYKFGARVADVIVCPQCGCYIASSIEGPAGRVATLNVVGAGIAALAARAARAIAYDDETPDAKRARRLTKWTPTIIAAMGEGS
jgi:hypothetical protein